MNGALSASKAIRERNALIQKASFDAADIQGEAGPPHIDCWLFNERESKFETYRSVDELQRAHGLGDDIVSLASVVDFKGGTNNLSGRLYTNPEIAGAVRWFHTTGDFKEGIESLGLLFGISPHHYSTLTRGDWECEFVCGKTSQEDYLRITLNEIRFLSYDPKSADAAVEAERLSSRNNGKHAAVHPKDELALLEIPLVIFLFPDQGVIISIGAPGRHEGLLDAARVQLLNRRSVLYREYARGIVDKPSFSTMAGTALEGREAGRAAACGALLVVILDALIDEIFPALDVFGDVIEGVQIINDRRCVPSLAKNVPLAVSQSAATPNMPDFKPKDDTPLVVTFLISAPILPRHSAFSPNKDKARHCNTEIGNSLTALLVYGDKL
jgi:hypothetical protein